MNLDHWLGKDGDAVWAEYLTAQKLLEEKLAIIPIIDSSGEE